MLHPRFALQLITVAALLSGAPSAFAQLTSFPEWPLMLPGVADFDFVSSSCAMSGDVAILGAPFDNTVTGENSGSAMIFRRDGDTWVLEQVLEPSLPVQGDLFGINVAISGNSALVAASTDIGDLQRPGSVFVFRFDGTSWVEEQILYPEFPDAYEGFGGAVAIDGDVAVIGARIDDTVVGANTGSASVFRFDGTMWNLEQTLVSSVPKPFGEFGYSVSLSNDVILVGAYREDTPAFQIAGAAYLFRFDGTSWVEEQRLSLPNGDQNDWYGQDTSLSGNVAVVTAPRALNELGAAYVYRYDGTSWIAEQELAQPTVPEAASFADRVAVSGDHVVVTAPFGDSVAGVDTGLGYLYRFDGVGWVETGQLVHSDAQPGDHLGRSVAMSGDFAVIGAPRYSGTGVEAGGAGFLFQIDGPDCNGNGLLDSVDIAAGLQDCDRNGVPDECQIAADPSTDLDGDGLLDDCLSDFVRADANGDGMIDLGDAITQLDYLFTEVEAPPCLEALDANADNGVDIADAIFTLAFLFDGGPQPSDPFPDCGPTPPSTQLYCLPGLCP